MKYSFTKVVLPLNFTTNESITKFSSTFGKILTTGKFYKLGDLIYPIIFKHDYN